jgi:hypothetical protein
MASFTADTPKTKRSGPKLAKGDIGDTPGIRVMTAERRK